VRLTSFIIGPGLALILALYAAGPEAAAADRATPLIVDHTCTSLEAIPTEWIEAARTHLRACYGHTSHGSQPIDGMQLLMDDPENPGLFDFTTDGSVATEMLSLADRTPAYDIGWGDGDFDGRTREYLNGEGSDRNLVIWSWCGQVSDAGEMHINEYLNRMVQLENEYPGVDFVYMTGHLDGTGEEGNLHQRNEQIRDFCRVSNKILFDFADIESYDPEGNAYLALYADDACNYSGGNWADEWCGSNPGSPLCLECEICAHSESLNCNLKARAFWWMLARIAGWEPAGMQTVACELVCQPGSGTLPLPVRFTTTLTNSFTGFTRRLSGRIDVHLADGSLYTHWRAGTANIGAGESLVSVWVNSLPANQAMVGDNGFTFVSVDVTPAPYNQPPYPPSGQTDSAGCTVTGQAR
jgi:hypothetical protein